MIAYIGRFNEGINGFKKGEYVAEAKLEELKLQLLNEEFIRINTSNWSKEPIKMVGSIIKAFQSCNHIIFHCSGNSFQRVKPILKLNKRIWKKKVHYIGYGNAFESYIRGNVNREAVCLADYWYVQTETMKNGLEELGFENVVCLYNFRHYTVLDENDLFFSKPDEPLKCCLYSRITKKKGIVEAVQAVRNINREGNLINLDLFGPVDDTLKDSLDSIIDNSAVSYRGVVSPTDSVSTLAKYDFMIFPTKFYFEGFAGSIIDAYSAGLPVIGSNFMNGHELIKDGKTGLIFDFNSVTDLENKIRFIVTNRDVLREMKINCLKEVKRYQPDLAIEPLLSRLT